MTALDPALCARQIARVGNTHGDFRGDLAGELAGQLEAALAENERLRVCVQRLEAEFPCVSPGLKPSGWVCPTCKDPKCGDV